MLPLAKVATWVAALLMVVGDAGSSTTHPAAPQPTLPPAPIAQAPAPLAPPVHHDGLAEPIKKNLGSGELYVPRGFWSDDGAYDLVLHFHGVPFRTEKAIEEAGIDAVLYTVNLGNGSGAYETPYEVKGMLDATLARVQKALASVGPMKSPHLRRLALSAWSAGYGAVVRILSHPEDAARVDAVLLADGMHAGFVRGHEVDPLRMAPFAQFAQKAVAGQTLMAVTHSSIIPDRHAYASTTDTASYLLGKLGVDDVAKREVGPRGMVQIDEADREGLHVRGYEGTDKAAHCDHLIAIGETLFPYLAKRWGE